MTDWALIQKDFEQGLSLRVLAEKYHISKSTIHEHATAGQWTRTPDGQDTGHRTPPKFADQPPTSTIATLANKMVGQLSKIADTPQALDLREHKLFADALSQYGKILLADVTTQQEPLQGAQGVLVPASTLPYITNEELDSIERIVALAEQRKAQAESDREMLERKRM